MDAILIEGIPPYDGEHELDLSYFLMRELRDIYRISELRGIEISEAILTGDIRIVVALAVVALQRKGLVVDPDTFWEARAGQLKIVLGGEADPPVKSPPTESGGQESESEKSEPTGQNSEITSDASQEADPSPTGSPHLAAGLA